MPRPGASGSFGYEWRQCPFSNEYKEKYYDNGFDGNSNYPNLPVPSGDITIHTTTSGNLIMVNRGGGLPGWLCVDDACGYYIRYGKRFFES